MGNNASAFPALWPEITNSTVLSVLTSRGPRPLTKIPSTATVSDALDVLRGAGVTGAPIVTADNEVLGVVEMADIVNYVVSLESSGSEKRARESFFLDPVELALRPGAEVKKVKNTTSLADLSALFVSGTRRALVVDDSGSLPVDFVSQLDVVQWLIREFINDHLTPLERLTLLDLRLGVDTAVGSVKSTDQALAAFAMMSQFDISAVPCVDPVTGMIMTQLSVSDLKGINVGNFSDLHLPAAEFVDKVRPQRQAPVCVTPKDTIANLLAAFADSPVPIHRVWVTDANRLVMGVVSLEDIISLIRDVL
jgi:CBS-domain-containing membrane protein